MGAREDADLGGERADVVEPAAVDALAALEDVLPDGLDLEAVLNFAARSAFIAAVVSLTASWRASLPGIVRTSANFSPKPARAASSRSLRHASPSTTFFSALPSLARSSFWMATIFATHSWPNLSAARKSASGISLAPPSIMRKRSAVPE